MILLDLLNHVKFIFNYTPNLEVTSPSSCSCFIFNIIIYPPLLRLTPIYNCTVTVSVYSAGQRPLCHCTAQVYTSPQSSAAIHKLTLRSVQSKDSFCPDNTVSMS